MCSGETLKERAVRGFAHSGFGHLMDAYSRFLLSGEQFEIILKKNGIFWSWG